MRTTFILTAMIAIGVMSYSEASAQRDLFRNLGRELGNQGREMLQRELGNIIPQQGGGGGIQTQRSGIPSEGGGTSGGNRRDFIGESEFMLPGGGGFANQPQPIIQQPQIQPQPGFGNQPFYPSQPQPTNPQYSQPSMRATFPDDQSQSRFVDQGQVQTVFRTNTSASPFPGNPVMSNQYVVIRCPDSVSGSITYSLVSNGRKMSYTMSAGQEQRFRVGTSWVIEYNDGSKLRKYALNGGKTYTMRRENDGRWQLYSIKSQGS